MSIARIQFLHKTDIGWHIRFTAQDDNFYTMLDHFKDEQRKSAKINCHWNPHLFDKKGGWFITERILLKYADYFENYAAMRGAADIKWDMDHQEDLWGETKSEREEEESRKKQQEYEQKWKEYDEKVKQAKERERQWKQWEREEELKQKRERQQHYEQSRPPTRPSSTGLTLSEALIELGFSALAHPTELEVKKAFRQLAMKKHPDHGGAHEAMIKLNKAYQLVLWSVQGVKV